AFGPLAALGAYFCWWFVASGMPLSASLPLAALASAAVGALCWRYIYRPFELNGSPSIVILIASLGLFIFIENAIGVVFGSDTKAIADAPAGLIELGGVTLTVIQVLGVLWLAVVAAGMAGFVAYTRAGRAILAMNDNPEMATVVGINTQGIAKLVFAIGSAIACVAASLMLLREGAHPHMGFQLVFMAFVAVIVGGVGSLRGAVIGGLLLGLVESLGMWKIPSEWQGSIAFVVLFLVLLVRPQGLLGGR
ncbi:MAG: branched-chain amino acid ABC transporter permease, partial [Desulfobacterales bacterium]|nr:branched-chain amino acid ABC transporter permease [Desulfobacterales bacterium]